MENIHTFKKYFNNSKFARIAIEVLFVFLLLGLINVVPLVGRTASVSYFAPTSAIKYYTFGYNDTVTDLLWLRLIQDYDYCEYAKSKKSDSIWSGMQVRNSGCNKGWVFHMLDIITELSPRFRTPYATGGLVLDFLVHDSNGATLIYDKAVIRFPNDWPILYRAGYHYMAENQNI
ncbi:MAG: hypothetical protein A2Z20_10750, partial [Bdellovibrionales bacterium RBG_16_40_8]